MKSTSSSNYFYVISKSIFNKVQGSSDMPEGYPCRRRGKVLLAKWWFFCISGRDEAPATCGGRNKKHTLVALCPDCAQLTSNLLDSLRNSEKNSEHNSETPLSSSFKQKVFRCFRKS